jgi:acyl-CoA thioester hydrolase
MDFPVKLSLRIDYSELDTFGHVNNVMFMKYVQAARVNYWDQIGLYQHFVATRLGPMLASVTCDYRKPLHYPGSVVVQTRMKHIGNTSFSFQHQILNEEGDLVAEAEDVMVMFNFNKNEKLPFPKEFRNKVEALEGKTF